MNVQHRFLQALLLGVLLTQALSGNGMAQAGEAKKLVLCGGNTHKCGDECIPKEQICCPSNQSAEMLLSGEQVCCPRIWSQDDNYPEICKQASHDMGVMIFFSMLRRDPLFEKLNLPTLNSVTLAEGDAEARLWQVPALGSRDSFQLIRLRRIDGEVSVEFTRNGKLVVPQSGAELGHWKDAFAEARLRHLTDISEVSKCDEIILDGVAEILEIKLGNEYRVAEFNNPTSQFCPIAMEYLRFTREFEALIPDLKQRN